MEFNRFFSDQKYMNEMRPVFSKRALYSDTTENYVTPPEPAPYSRVKIAFRTKRSNVDRVFLVCKGQKNLMFKASSDAQFDYYEVKLQLDNEKISWYFEIQAGAITCYYDFRGVVKRPDEHYNFVLIPGFDTPEWAKGAVMYQIYVDRFCNGDPTNDVLTNEYHYIGAKSQHVEDWYRYPSSMDVRDFYGGDLQGVLDKMDYLEQLGVEVIYFNPLFVSPSNHKYDSQDYDHVDPHCGKIVKDGGRLLEDWETDNTHADRYILRTTDSENLEASDRLLIRVIEEAHKRGMKIVMDAVFNHTGREFFAFEDIMEKGEKSKYLDWYYIEKFPLESERGEIPNYKCFGYYGGMPKLNLKNPEVEKFFTDVACYWIKECDIDGWRMDVGDEISHYFWKNFRRAVKAVKKDMLIIGEIWHYAGDFLEGDEWDTVMNYPFYLNMIDLLADEKIHVSQFVQNLGYLKGRLNKKCYPLMWNLIDSHDTARFLHLCNGNKKKQHLAAAFQLLLPGMPMIYYGDEFAMPGANDPDCRRGMYWDEEYQDKEMYEWYKQLLWIRKKHACISEGELIGAITKDEEETIVLIRKNVEETIALIFNCSSNAKNFSEYEGKYNLLRDEPFDGKVEGLDAAVIVL